MLSWSAKPRPVRSAARYSDRFVIVRSLNQSSSVSSIPCVTAVSAKCWAQTSAMSPRRLSFPMAWTSSRLGHCDRHQPMKVLHSTPVSPALSSSYLACRSRISGRLGGRYRVFLAGEEPPQKQRPVHDDQGLPAARHAVDQAHTQVLGGPPGFVVQVQVALQDPFLVVV